MIDIRNNVWVEKYRPKKLDDLILSDENLSYFKGIINDKVIPHLLLTGPAGTGKTASAQCICNELGVDRLFINGSADRGISTVTNDISGFASKISINSDFPKIIIIDEANLSAAAYDALRGYIEGTHHNARFIITTNYPETIPDPIMSRLNPVYFGIEPSIMKKFALRLAYIWETESGKKLIKDDQILLTSFVKKFFPDMRRCINRLQSQFIKYKGELNESILVDFDNKWFEDYYASLKFFDFNNIRSLLKNPSVVNIQSFFTRLYNDLDDVFEKESIPDAVLIISKYQGKARYSFNYEIELAAMSVLLKDLKFQ